LTAAARAPRDNFWPPDVKGEAATFEPSRAAIDRGFSTATAAEVVLSAQQYLRVGAARSAVAVCTAAKARGLSDPALELSEAMARFAAGERLAGLSLVDAVLALTPENAGALTLKAHMVAALGRAAEGRELLLRAVEAYPDYPGALPLLSSLVFPGPPYREVLTRMHRLLAPETYLEIGVDTGATLALASSASLAVGVDPAAGRVERRPANARLYAMESDTFFEHESQQSVFGGRAVDLTFIDGMHRFENALRDFAHAERWSSKGSTIVLHDCLPVAPAAALPERASLFWVGDVWKIVEVLLECRSELQVAVVPTSPSGLVVVRGLDPESTVLFTDRDAIVARYRDRPFELSPGAWPPRYGVVENSDAGIAAALGRAP
jgi:hypothetical protein